MRYLSQFGLPAGQFKTGVRDGWRRFRRMIESWLKNGGRTASVLCLPGKSAAHARTVVTNSTLNGRSTRPSHAPDAIGRRPGRRYQGGLAMPLPPQADQ